MSFVTAVLYFHKTFRVLNFDLGKFLTFYFNFLFQGIVSIFMQGRNKINANRGQVLNKACVLLL